jgi:hypothetical protein
MPEQSYANHRKVVPVFLALLGVLTLTVIGSIINLVHSLGNHSRLYNASLILALSLAVFVLAFFARTFALKAQDRVIRAEENLRHFVLTGKLLDPRLTVKQTVGLRFASDAEFPALAAKAAAESLSLDDIKKSVKNWRPDHDRL